MNNDTQNALTAERQSLQAEDERRILIDIWSPSQPRALIHLFHGLGEHPARYERFASYCNDLGFVVAAHNHRGHGENCSGDDGYLEGAIESADEAISIYQNHKQR